MTGSPPSFRLVLVTAARNEEAFIGRTLASVEAQTRRPERWVIVSDGSTDGTDEIVGRYSRKHAWIRLLRMPEHRDRHFAAKAAAFNSGLALLAGQGYEVIGNLDADISFGPDYFAFLLDKFSEDPRLGVAGTPFSERNRTYDFRYASTEHVSGACQLFRRECFAEIGGYRPIRGGAIDWVAVTTARMQGWKTRTFPEMTCLHHRPIGTGGGGRLLSFLRQGRKDAAVGSHPIWEISRAFFHMRQSPLLVGGLGLLGGYVWETLRPVKSPIPEDLRLFHRNEQRQRLVSLRRRVLKRLG